MKRTNSQGFLVRYQHPQRLSQWRETFASQFKPIKPAHDPLEPFMTVTDDVLTVRDARHGLRFAYLLPLVVGLWILSCGFISDLVPSSESMSYGRKVLASYEEKRANGELFDEFHENRYQYYRTIFDRNGNYSILSYRKAIFTYGRESQKKSLISDFVITSVILSLTLFFTVFFIKSPKPAHIYFDRKRGLVYTWFFGRLAACRFENLGFLERKTGLLLYLYCENKKRKGGYDVFPVTVQPTGKVHLNSERDNNYFFAQVFNFMDNGKSAIITGKSFHRPESKTYFFIDKRPEPFEERLEKLLEYEHVLPELYENLKVVN
ncbi:conserved hypothetical protein [Vibrio jasicida]|uniref:Uncharacterized protein n=1 Tax=Vibrio jasicida TaxID=766224 RepID=A0AAU9QUT1_9VIBR|nr:conserved hypothetical protein [Vibrio jasicida]CAH1602488.1 conserved hypothetical protein [Vibrio jasicida]